MIVLTLAVAMQVVAITHVTVVDVEQAASHSDLTVVVNGPRIVAVGPARSTRIPVGAHVIDGRGKWLIPGLWDMHVHSAVPTGQQLLSLYVANGVTGVRDMGGELDLINEWRRAIATGSLVGPRIVAAGPYLEGHGSPIAHIEVHTPDDARRAVDSLSVLGVDFVKVHSALPRETFFAAAREARAKHLALAGHLSRNVTVEEASDSGQRSLEHLLGFINVCSPAESVAFATADPLRRIVFNSCTSHDQRAVYQHLARNGTWVTPTLTPAWEFAVLPQHDVPGDTLARFLSDTLQRYMVAIFDPPPELPPEASILGQRMFAKRHQLVLNLYQAGVPLLAGTDAPMRNSPPGFGLHEEMLEFVRSGLTPAAALRTATYEPARYFGALDSLG
ncbi:MAG TPA: amidohydrolase family protein, partial [Gemmatimonadaceae bacterium]|nr:amidohydrolase family protein [Gemmatimonadaceae bacterium]